MIDAGKRSVLGVDVDVVDYEAAVARIMSAAKNRRPYAVTALAVHGVMTGVDDDQHRLRLNDFELVTPDGQPVRWALNRLHGVELRERVYGPDLTLAVCAAAASAGVPVYFYGSRPEVLERLTANLQARFPTLVVAGSSPSMFRNSTSTEKGEIVAQIRRSGAGITFVGLGCPRQEVWAYEYRRDLSMPVIAVGAAFDYHSGTVTEPPAWVQRRGLQWLYRLGQDPRRLWRRYLVLNPRFVNGLFTTGAGAELRRPGVKPAPLVDVPG